MRSTPLILAFILVVAALPGCISQEASAKPPAESTDPSDCSDPNACIEACGDDALCKLQVCLDLELEGCVHFACAAATEIDHMEREEIDLILADSGQREMQVSPPGEPACLRLVANVKGFYPGSLGTDAEALENWVVFEDDWGEVASVRDIEVDPGLELRSVFPHVLAYGTLTTSWQFRGVGNATITVASLTMPPME